VQASSGSRPFGLTSAVTTATATATATVSSESASAVSGESTYSVSTKSASAVSGKCGVAREAPGVSCKPAGVCDKRVMHTAAATMRYKAGRAMKTG